MAFKSFTCVTANANNAVPPEGWSATGDAILIANNTDLVPQYYMPCDPTQSRFVGAAPISYGMTEEEFYSLWPLLVVTLMVAFGFKLLRRIFQ